MGSLGEFVAIQKRLGADWDAVEKNADGRVELAGFKAFLEAKYKGEINANAVNAFDQFLNRCFEAGTGLMLPASKNSLGRHCFSYAVLLAGEFYFAAANVAADAGCACDTPVKDVLGLAK